MPCGTHIGAILVYLSQCSCNLLASSQAGAHVVTAQANNMSSSEPVTCCSGSTLSKLG